MSPGPAPAPLAVSPAQQAVLTALLRRSSCPQALALRARIILGAAAGQRNEPLGPAGWAAPRTPCASGGPAGPPPPRTWPIADDDRPALERAIAAALADAPRPGAPATFTAEQIVQIINLACRPPEQLGRPVAAWTPRELADEAVQQGIVATISPRSVERFLGRGRPPAAPEPLLAQRQGQGRRPGRVRRAGGDDLHRLCLRPDAGGAGLPCRQHRRDDRHPGAGARRPDQADAPRLPRAARARVHPPRHPQPDRHLQRRHRAGPRPRARADPHGGRLRRAHRAGPRHRPGGALALPRRQPQHPPVRGAGPAGGRPLRASPTTWA